MLNTITVSKAKIGKPYYYLMKNIVNECHVFGWDGGGGFKALGKRGYNGCWIHSFNGIYIRIMYSTAGDFDKIIISSRTGQSRY